MTEAARTVFLSYRREVSWAMAQLVFRELVAHGFDVFMDTASIDAGEFERVILTQIEARTHFLVLLEPRSLNRIGADGDWLRREISHALAHRRNIVPLVAGGARMPRSADLPADVARLAAFNAVSMPADYVAEAMQKLRERFLRAPETVQDDVAAIVSRGLAALRLPVLSAVQVRAGVQLSWTVAADTDHFELERSRGLEFDLPVTVYRGPARHAVDDGLVPGNLMHYRVRAIRDGVAGPWSQVVRIEVGGVAAPPPRPAVDAPPVVTGRRDGDRMLLEWTRVWPAKEYQLSWLRPFESEPPGEASNRQLYRGPERTHRLAAADGTVPSLLRCCVRGLDARGRPMTDWSEPVVIG